MKEEEFFFWGVFAEYDYPLDTCINGPLSLCQ